MTSTYSFLFNEQTQEWNLSQQENNDQQVTLM